MAVDELKDPICLIKSKEIYIDEKKINLLAMNDYVEGIEIEVNYFRHYINAILICFEDLFTLSKAKHPSALNNSDTIRIIFTDNTGNTFDRRFTVIKATSTVDYNSKRSPQWTIELRDTYGYFLDDISETAFLTEAGFSGTPIEIVEKAIKTVTNDISDCFSESPYNDRKLKIDVKRNNLDFVCDDNPTLDHRFVKDLTPFENIKKFADKYNIHIYQDFDTLHIIQNPTFENVKVSKCSDNTALFKEGADGRQYLLKICDKIKQESAIRTDDRANYKVSLNLGGKEQSFKELAFDQAVRVMELNSNSDEDFHTKNTIEISSSEARVSTLMNSAFNKYMKANNLVIYTRTSLPYCVPGTCTTIDLQVNSEFLKTREKGDYRYSGNWLIRSTTLKILYNQNLISRMVLCRFDNPKDVTKEEVEDVITESNPEDVLTSKPEKPLNYEEENFFDKGEQKPVSGKELAETLNSSKVSQVQQMASIARMIESVGLTINSTNSALNSFLSDVDGLSKYKNAIMLGIKVFLDEIKDSTVMSAIDETFESLKQTIKPLADGIKKVINSIEESFNTIKNYIQEVTGSITSGGSIISDVKEVASRISNTLSKYLSTFRSVLQTLENTIISELGHYVNIINSEIDGFIKKLSNKLLTTINNDVKKEHPVLGGGLIGAVTVAVEMGIKPFAGQIKDKMYEPLRAVSSKIREIRKAIETAAKPITDAVETVNSTIRNTMTSANQIAQTPERLLRRITTQGVNILREDPKEILKQDIKSTVNTVKARAKRDNILKAMR